MWYSNASMKYKLYKKYEYRGRLIQAYGNNARELADCMKRKEQAIDLNNGSENMSFNEWCEICIERYKRESVRKDIKTVLKSRFYPHFKGLRLTKITTRNLQEALNELSGMSMSYINQAYQAIRFIFKYAVIEELLAKDPSLALVKPIGTRKKRRALTAKEREAVIKVAKTKKQYYAFLLMLYCGCRPSEATECKGKDIISVDGIPTLHIRGQKTALSDRFVPIPKELYPLIKKTPKNEYISPTEKGNKQNKDKLRRTWLFFRRKLDIELGATIYRNAIVESVISPDLVPYCFRHEYCTDLARKGIDIRLAQRLMGHTNIKMTADIYTNLETSDIISKTKSLAE